MMNWFRKKELNKQQNTKQHDKVAKVRPIVLQLQDKHEPFGDLSIEHIKAVLQEEDFSQMQSLYFYMMRDLKIASAVLTRSQQLIGRDFRLQVDNEEIKAWLLANVPLDELVTQLASAIYYGVSLSDVRYQLKDLKLVPSFQHISPRWLYADSSSDNQLKSTFNHLYIKQDQQKLFLHKLQSSRIVFHKHPIDIGELTDFSLASKLVWYFSLKHLTLAHNLHYFDNVATPPLIAKSSGNEDELINTLYALKSACVGVFDKDDVVEYLKVDNQADFMGFIEYIDRQISTLILGNTLSTGEGKNGSRAQSQIHENRQLDILRFDARLIEKTIDQYLKQVIQLNFEQLSSVSFRFVMPQHKNLLDLSAVVKNLSESGFMLDEADIEAQFGFKMAAKDKNTQANNQQQRLEHNQQKKPKPKQQASDALDKQSQAITTKSIEQFLLQELETILSKSESYDDAFDALLSRYPDFNMQELEAALFQAMANSKLLAASEVEDEEVSA